MSVAVVFRSGLAGFNVSTEETLMVKFLDRSIKETFSLNCYKAEFDCSGVCLP